MVWGYVGLRISKGCVDRFGLGSRLGVEKVLVSLA